jgi:hypothetical protein
MRKKMIKLLLCLSLLTACKDEGIRQLIYPGSQVDAASSSELQTVLDRLNVCSRLYADTTADYLRHMRADHLEKENPPEDGHTYPAWPFERPDGWVKVEYVCPTGKYTSKCRTTEWFHEHPSAILPNGKLAK